MIFIITLAYSLFPQRNDELLIKSESGLDVQSSGSLGYFMGDSKCIPTFPNETLNNDPYNDWCSNLIKGDEGYPWISFHIPKKSMKLRGYSIRNGCCYHYRCCCNYETGERYDFECCCELYSFSLQGSNDNKTWTTIHRVEKDDSIYWCKTLTFEFSETQSFNFVRVLLEETRPGCQKCFQINQIQLYGSTIISEYGLSDFLDDEENQESISIIGKVKHA